jgi:hypothetical protein
MSETAEDLIRISQSRGTQGDPPFKENLTIIWEHEKKALLTRLDTQAQMIEQLAQRVKTLEAWAIQLKREPTIFVTSEGEQQRYIAVRLPPEATQHISPMEKDYEGPTEGGREP